MRLRQRGQPHLVRRDWPSRPQRPPEVSEQAGLHEDEDQAHGDAAAGVSEAVGEGLEAIPVLFSLLSFPVLGVKRLHLLSAGEEHRSHHSDL